MEGEPLDWKFPHLEEVSIKHLLSSIKLMRSGEEKKAKINILFLKEGAKRARICDGEGKFGMFPSCSANTATHNYEPLGRGIMSQIFAVCACLTLLTLERSRLREKNVFLLKRETLGVKTHRLSMSVSG